MPEPGLEKQDRGGRMQELASLAQRVMQRISDPKTPFFYKAIPAAALLYVISPIDLIPDTIPVLTQLDDIAVLILAARLFVALTDHNQSASSNEDDEPPTVTTTYRVRDE